jgi:hypothetical protein
MSGDRMPGRDGENLAAMIIYLVVAVIHCQRDATRRLTPPGMTVNEAD